MASARGPSQALQVVALAEAGPEVGLGHLARSSAVVVALRAKGATCRCLGLGAPKDVRLDGVTWKPATASDVRSATAGAGAVLLDSYLLPDPVVDELTPPRVLFHDHGEPPAEAALVVAPAWERSPAPHWLCGLEHSCLRPGYWGVEPIQVRAEVTTVLIATGAGDPGGIALGLASAALTALPRAIVHRVRGPQAGTLDLPGVVEVRALDDLHSRLAGADLVVCLAGQIAVESACLGVPTVAVAAVDNQRANLQRLAAAGAVVAAELDDGLPETLGRLARDEGGRLALSQAARRAVDGFGALRVAARIQRLLD